MIKSLLLTLLFISTAQASSIPTSPKTELNSKFIFRFFYKVSPDLNSIFEYDYSTESESRKEKKFRLGARYRLHRNFKLGFFYKNAKGQRHDDDWVWKNSTWFWTDTQNRSEDIFVLEASYRNHLFNFSSTIFELRFSGEMNTFNSQNSLKFRPGITHFFTSGFNLYALYEAYFPLNYSESTIYEHWIYTGLIYRYNKNIRPGIFYNYRNGAWTSSKDFIDRNPSQSYKVNHSSHYLGLSLNLYY